VRAAFGLPPVPPKAVDGIPCPLCGNGCRIPEGGLGFCGLRTNRGGKLVHLAGTPDTGILQWYRDPLPTNCVSIDVCAGGCGAGHPRFAHVRGPEHGFSNLAVFYGACTFNCLGCQNWHFRHLTAARGPALSARDLAGAVDARTSCICYFGGDPAPQIEHALATSRLAREDFPGILRICWETNGSSSPRYMEEAARLSLESGGTVKIDVKALYEPLHLALSGVSNRATLQNVERLAALAAERPDPPLLSASTLLIPGYVGPAEVGEIARFLAGLDPGIPYSLLAFSPRFSLQDLPLLERAEALECLEAARRHLARVRIGNTGLLV
jgi:pyruvate formate lyase activating enzyme